MTNTDLASLNRQVHDALGLPQMFTLKKRGLYYRPGGHGYTPILSEAWKLTEAEADKHTYPHDEPVTKHPIEPESYAADLNAMHEAVATLSGLQKDLFADHLATIVDADLIDGFDKRQGAPQLSWPGVAKVATATAEQRGRALLATLNQNTK